MQLPVYVASLVEMLVPAGVVCQHVLEVSWSSNGGCVLMVDFWLELLAIRVSRLLRTLRRTIVRQLLFPPSWSHTSTIERKCA